MNEDLLVRSLVAPELVESFNLADWDRLIPAARREGLLGRLEAVVSDRKLLDSVPESGRAHLQSARVAARNEERVMWWEINRIQRALDGISSPVVLLKGAAYILAGLPVARGRVSTDVDILGAKNEIKKIEERLLAHGWQHIKLDEYDQYFYRQWSHELPPLRHKDRSTVVDVHHTILPPTGRLHPDPEKLLQASVPVAGTNFRVLAPADMVLHSAAHAFQDGDLTRGLRDLIDIEALLRHFNGQENFWGELLSRAEELELSGPLFYAIRYARQFLATPIPDVVVKKCQDWQPARPALVLMDRLVCSALGSVHAQGRTLGAKSSLWCLYVRAHWLRMPPRMLAKHLLHQAVRRWSRRQVT